MDIKTLGGYSLQDTAAREAVAAAQAGVDAINARPLYDLGLGTEIPAGADLNDYTAPGIYRSGQNGAELYTNTPYGSGLIAAGNWFTMNVYKGSSEEHVIQEIFFTYSRLTFKRRYSATSTTHWTEWSITSIKDPMTLSASVSIPSGADLNAYTTAGVYECTYQNCPSVSNKPWSAPATGSLVLTVYKNLGLTIQSAFNVVSGSRHRRYVGSDGNWTSWAYESADAKLGKELCGIASVSGGYKRITLTVNRGTNVSTRGCILMVGNTNGMRPVYAVIFYDTAGNGVVTITEPLKGQSYHYKAGTTESSYVAWISGVSISGADITITTYSQNWGTTYFLGFGPESIVVKSTATS